MIASCADKPASRPLPPEPDKVSGSLTINGKTDSLTHVYAHRMVFPGSKREYFALVFSNKAVPEDAMPKAFQDLDLAVIEQDFLPDKSIRGLAFVVKKTSPLPGFPVSYNGYVINAGRVYLTTGSFDDFSLQKGRVQGKESLAHYDGSEVEIAPGDQRTFTYKYSVAFEATPQGQPAYKEFEGAARPNIPYRLSKQGKADGSLTFDDNTIDLKYAYALRTREFFDEPEEHIQILATDRPLSEKVLVEVLVEGKNPITMDIQGVVLNIYTHTSEDFGIDICHKSGSLRSGAPVEGLSITARRITAKTSEVVEEARRHSWNYSVTVDVPFEE